MRWVIKIAGSLLTVYFWWITNSWILLDVLVIGLLVVLCETIYIVSLKHAIYLLLVMCLFECGFKYIFTRSIFGPTIFDIMLTGLDFQSLPIGFLIPFFTPRSTGRCSVASFGDLAYPCLYLALCSRWNEKQQFYFVLPFFTFVVSQFVWLFITWMWNPGNKLHMLYWVVFLILPSVL